MQFTVRAYILTDKDGEWWEFLNTNGDTRMFYSGTAKMTRTKFFKSQGAAIRAGKKLKQTKAGKIVNQRFQVLQMTPPVKPSRTWGQETVYDSKDEK